MSCEIFKNNCRFGSLILSLVFSGLIMSGCSVEAAKSEAEKAVEEQSSRTKIDTSPGEKKNFAATAGRIEIKSNSPADAIQTFYQNLREQRFREAIFLTNLRPAIEGLTDAELKELEVDFGLLAQTVPPDIQINGEIISGEAATVTAKLPDNETGKLELKEFKLARKKGGWLILLVEKETEAMIKSEGKNYFFALRIKVHQAEAEAMMRRIVKAQMVYAIQNGGLFGDVQSLVESNLLPPDAQNAASTGYRYSIFLSPDKKKYKASAEPEIYNKTGRLSYFLEVEENNQSPPLKSADRGGKPLKG